MVESANYKKNIFIAYITQQVSIIDNKLIINKIYFFSLIFTIFCFLFWVIFIFFLEKKFLI